MVFQLWHLLFKKIFKNDLFKTCTKSIKENVKDSTFKENIKNNAFKDLHETSIAILENNMAVPYKLKYVLQENTGVNLCDLGLDTISWILSSINSRMAKEKAYVGFDQN